VYVGYVGVEGNYIKNAVKNVRNKQNKGVGFFFVAKGKKKPALGLL
jgi:hypothetical protein